MRLLVAMMKRWRRRMARLLRLTGNWSGIPSQLVRDSCHGAVHDLIGRIIVATMEFLILVWSILSKVDNLHRGMQPLLAVVTYTPCLKFQSIKCSPNKV